MTPYEEGYKDFKGGYALSTPPFGRGDPEYKEWARGWVAAQNDQYKTKDNRKQERTEDEQGK